MSFDKQNLVFYISMAMSVILIIVGIYVVNLFTTSLNDKKESSCSSTINGPGSYYITSNIDNMYFGKNILIFAIVLKFVCIIGMIYLHFFWNRNVISTAIAK